MACGELWSQQADGGGGAEAAGRRRRPWDFDRVQASLAAQGLCRMPCLAAAGGGATGGGAAPSAAGGAGGGRWTSAQPVWPAAMALSATSAGARAAILREWVAEPITLQPADCNPHIATH